MRLKQYLNETSYTKPRSKELNFNEARNILITKCKSALDLYKKRI